MDNTNVLVSCEKKVCSLRLLILIVLKKTILIEILKSKIVQDIIFLINTLKTSFGQIKIWSCST